MPKNERRATNGARIGGRVRNRYPVRQSPEPRVEGREDPAKWRCLTCGHNWTFHERRNCRRGCPCQEFVPASSRLQGTP